MNETFYTKVGRKYIPVKYYDSKIMDSFPEGSHIVTVYPGGLTKRYKVDPAFLPMMAAGRFAEEGMAAAMMSIRERDGSCRDIIDAGVMAMAVEADKMMAVPAIKEAYDHFMMLCKLCYQENVDVKV